MSKSSAPIPQPSAAIIVLISSLPSILSKRAFSTFRILPLSGRMAWNRRSRPCLADPPADSPSTMYSSLSAGSRSWQSASLPGSELRPALLRVDVVRERIHDFRVAVVPLQSDLDVGAVLLAVHVDRLLVDGGLVLVQVRHERDDAALVMELVRLAVALVVERNQHAAVQEGELPEPLRER